MFELNTILFFSLVAMGAMVQTITGFAMGLIIIAGVTALGLAEISFSAAVVSFISLTNTAVALRHNHRHIDYTYLRQVSFGLLPTLILGVLLLDYLSGQFYELLKPALGVVIIAAGVLLMITPAAYSRESPASSIIGCGMLGGLIAGLYSAGGAPLAYFMYRQPIPLNTIRATLLAIFAVSTLGRTLVAGAAGHVDWEVLKTVAVAIPIVIASTMLTSRYVQMIPDRLVRRMVFVLLIAVGTFLIVNSAQGDFSIHTVSQ